MLSKAFGEGSEGFGGLSKALDEGFEENGDLSIYVVGFLLSKFHTGVANLMPRVSANFFKSPFF